MQFQADILGIPVGVLLSSMLLPKEQLLELVWLWVLAGLLSASCRSQDQIFIRAEVQPSARVCHMAESSKAVLSTAALHLQDAPHLFQQRRYF